MEKTKAKYKTLKSWILSLLFTKLSNILYEYIIIQLDQEITQVK